MVKGKKFILTKRFTKDPKPDDFTLEEFDVPKVKDGEILAQAEYLSVDPYMRSSGDALKLGTIMIGSQIAKIIESKNPNWPVGKRIFGTFGWTTHTVCNPDELPDIGFILAKPYIIPEIGDLPISLALGVLGMTGNTAYFGLIEICDPKVGETLVVSGAAGAIGSHVGQIGKALGLKVIGITGSSEKCKWIVDELGFDHAIDYKTEDVTTALKKAAPDGVDCYFDNVGGEISSIVMYQMRKFGRVAVCGSISAYNDPLFSGTKFLPKATVLQPVILSSQLKIEGFVVSKWKSRWMDTIQKNADWIREGKLRYRETLTEGFNNLPKAFIGMLKGENFGKAIVKV